MSLTVEYKIPEQTRLCRLTPKNGLHHPDKELRVIPHVNDWFENALSYRKSRHPDKPYHNNDVVTWNVDSPDKRLQVEMRKKIIYSFDLISRLSFLPSFKLACDSNSVHKGPLVTVKQFMNHPATQRALHMRGMLDKRHKCGSGTPCCEIVSYIIETYKTVTWLPKTTLMELAFLNNGTHRLGNSLKE